MSADTETAVPFRLVIGGRWLDEARRLERHDSRRWVGAYDHDVLRAHFDVLLGARNITSGAPDEPVIPFLGAWVRATARLAAGAPRARVEFDESPLEIAVERRGPNALISLFELGSPGRFAADRVAVRLDELLSGVAAATADAAALARSQGIDAVRSLDALLDDLGRVELPAGTAPAAPAPSHFVVETESEAGLALITTLRPETTGLSDGLARDELDRHVLLAAGELCFRTAGEPDLALPGRPLRVLEALLDGLVALVRRSGRRSTETEEVALADGMLHLRYLAQGTVALERSGGGGLVGREVLRDDLARVVAEHAEAVVRGLVRLNVSLAPHPILAGLVADAALVRPPRGADVPPSGAVGAPRHGPAPPTGQSAMDGFGFPAHAIRRMRYERAWTLDLPGVDARRTVGLGEELFLVPHADGTAVVHATSGRIIAEVGRAGDDRHLMRGDALHVVGPNSLSRWSVPEGGRAWTQAIAPREPAAPFAAGDGLAVFVGADHRLHAHRAEGGVSAWTSAALPAQATGLSVGDGIAVAVTPGRVWAYESSDGGLRWTCQVPYDRIAVRAVGGDCVVVADDPLADAVSVGVLDGATGHWARRHEAAADVRAVAWEPDRGVCALVSDGEEARLMVMDVRSGVDWTVLLPWDGAGAPSRCVWTPDVVLVGANGRVSGVRPDGVVWELAERGSMFTLAHRTGPSGLAFLLTDDEVRVIEASRGRELHRISAFWERLSGLVADGRGHLLAIEEIPGRGTVVHGVGAVGVIAALDGGRAAG